MAKRPSARQLAARRAFVARFGGKKAKRVARVGRRNPPAMARRSSRRRSSPRRFGGVSQASIINGALGGAAANIGARYLGPWGSPVGLAAVGVFRKEPTLQLLAGISVGNTLAGSIPLPGAGGSMGAAGVL